MFKRIGDEVVRLIYEFGIFKFDKSDSLYGGYSAVG